MTRLNYHDRVVKKVFIATCLVQNLFQCNSAPSVDFVNNLKDSMHRFTTKVTKNENRAKESTGKGHATRDHARRMSFSSTSFGENTLTSYHPEAAFLVVGNKGSVLVAVLISSVL